MAAVTITRWDILCPPGRKPYSRSMGGKLCCGSMKVTSSPWIAQLALDGGEDTALSVRLALQAVALGTIAFPTQEPQLRLAGGQNELGAFQRRERISQLGKHKEGRRLGQAAELVSTSLTA